MPLDLGPSRIKLAGAREHIERFKQKTVPLDRSLYDLSAIKTGQSYQLVYQPKGPIAEPLANIVGDALGNLRSALDYVAARIVGGSESVYFPVAPRKDLPSFKSLPAIEGALPGFKNLLFNEIRPAEDPNEALWGLIGKANNQNKHADFIPTLAMVRIENFNGQVGGMFMENCMFGGDATRPMNMISAPGPISFGSQFRTIINARFGPQSSVTGRPVIETLEQTASVVESALNKIDLLAKS